MAKFYKIIEMRGSCGRGTDCEVLVGIADGRKYTLCYEKTYRDSLFHDARKDLRAALVLTHECDKCGHDKAEYILSSSEL